MKKEIHELLKIQNDETTIFTNKELKMIDDYINKLEKENKILRENAEHNDKVVDKFNWENQLLKKQLEEERNKVREYSYRLVNFRCEETYENQQKEFIEWLTNEANINPYDISDYIYENIINAILSKYNGIIGSDSE